MLPLRVMMLSDRIIGGVSAYSKTGYEICVRLAKMGHKIAHIPMGYANKMGRQVWKNVLIFNSDEDSAFGETVAVKDYLQFKADLLITNKEPWAFQTLHRQPINFVPMAVIDHSPVSGQIVSRLQQAFKVIAISRFGQRELKTKGVDSTYIPLGVRTDIYKPLPKGDCKKLWHFEPDDFVIGVVAMNRARKMIPRMIRGYKRFLELNPKVKAHLMLWTNVLPIRPPADVSQGIADVGVNLLPEIFELGIGSGPNDVRWMKWDEVSDIGGIPDFDPQGRWDMARLYNSFDVNLLCSGGEGAGMTYLEAAACGVPSVYTNYAAAPEYCGPAGLPVSARDYSIIATPGVRYALADIDEMAEALTKILKGDRERWAKRCRLHAERFEWATIMENYWKPFLEEAALTLYPKLCKKGVETWS